MLPTFSSDAPQLSHPGKEATVAQDHNDLLMGLGSDDLNDFDGLDEFSTGIRNEEGELMFAQSLIARGRRSFPPACSLSDHFEHRLLNRSWADSASSIVRGI